MKKTLSKKLIGGREYFYLMYRDKGRLVSKYLGTASSNKYRRYLAGLFEEGKRLLLEEAARKAFSAGLPVAYQEKGKLILAYKSGVKEVLDERLRPVEVLR